MKIIGLTGGIGSGKSTVAHLLESHGIPLYNSDLRARNIMNESNTIISTLKEWYGDDIYENNILNRKKLGQQVFSNQNELNRLNQLVHPEVFKDFEQWKKQHSEADLILKETAILFESGSYKNCDFIVTVSAPEQIRINRVIERDQTTKKLVKDRMNKQWTDEQREEKSDYTIYNDDTLEKLKEQVEELYAILKDKFMKDYD